MCEQSPVPPTRSLINCFIVFLKVVISVTTKIVFSNSTFYNFVLRITKNTSVSLPFTKPNQVVEFFVVT